MPSTTKSANALRCKAYRERKKQEFKIYDRTHAERQKRYRERNQNKEGSSAERVRRHRANKKIEEAKRLQEQQSLNAMESLGLIACPPEPFSKSSDDRTLVDSDDNDCRSTVGVECEVTIEEDEELKDKKIFAEEKPLEMLEMVHCSPAIVTQNCSNASERLAGDEESIDVKNLEEEIPQSPNCQRSAESFVDVKIPEETPASSSC